MRIFHTCAYDVCEPGRLRSCCAASSLVRAKEKVVPWTKANLCREVRPMLCASRSNVRTLKKFAFVDGATVYLTRTNDEAAQQERRRLDSHVCRISTGTDGKQTGGAFVGRGQELVFTPKTTAPGHGRERVFTQAKQVLFSHVGPRPVTKTQEAAQSPL